MSALPLFDEKAKVAPLTTEPNTPIAAELYAHFAEGGSIADAIRLVERIERASSRMPVAKRSGQGNGAPWYAARAWLAALTRGNPVREEPPHAARHDRDRDRKIPKLLGREKRRERDEA
jgi:hypothetical protein